MINPNDLRLGNLLSCKQNKDENGIWSVSAIHTAHLEMSYSNTYAVRFEYSDLVGIPITSHILEILGNNQKYGMFYEIDLLQNIGQLMINPSNGLVWLKHHRLPDFKMNPHTPYPMCVHHLQNLYFTLTMRELKIPADIFA